MTIEELGGERGARLRLPDGRALGFRERGARDGAPILWFPGTPGSRLFTLPDEEATRARGVRVIVVERPGFGVSDFQEGRRVLDWPRDVEALAGALRLDRFAIAGPSGAGPFLAACAFAIPRRLTRVAMIGVAAPPDSPGWRASLSPFRRAVLGLARVSPRAIALASRRAPRDPERFYRAMTHDAPPADRRILDRPPVWRAQVAMMAEALRPGVRGFAWELHLGARPWGFSLGAIDAPVTVWHGTADAAMPIAMGRHLAAAIPGAKAHFLEGEGHFLHFDHWTEILDDLLSS